MKQIIAINKKYQATVNRFIKWDATYNKYVSVNDSLGKSDCRQQENAFNKAYELFIDLPKREQKNITKTLDTLGYGS